MNITFLEGSVPLSKTFSLLRNGDIEKSNYPNIRQFTSHTYNVPSLVALHTLMLQHADQGHCLLKGILQRDLVSESRAGSTMASAYTQWLCLDVDGLPGIDTIEDFLKLLPREFQNVSYIAQYSASMGVIDKGLSAHLFFMLNQETNPLLIKQWLTRINLDTPILRESLRLARHANTLKWTLDITVNQNDKLIFIAPPQLAPGLKDKFKGERVTLVKKAKTTLAFDFSNCASGRIKDDTLTALNEHRKREGLPPKRKINEKVYKDVIVESVSTAANVTGIKHDRGFTYLNLNGGDSWGYYHPSADPEVIYNFKNEPNYITKELLPEYYTQALSDAKEAKKERAQEAREAMALPASDGKHYLAFINPVEDRYYRGIYDPQDNRILQLHSTNKVKVLNDFLMANDRPVPDYFEEWNMEFRFDDDNVCDLENRVINTYQRTEALRNPKAAKAVPPNIKALLQHVLADKDSIYEHFLNWLAVILQHRVHLKTGWLMHGTQNTGKGTLLAKVLTPLLGDATGMVPAGRVGSTFNALFKDKVIVMVDEVDVGHFQEDKGLYALFKYITGNDTIVIEDKNVSAAMAKNYLHLIFASNHPYPIPIPLNDERINVGNFQEVPLQEAFDDVNALRDALEDEVPTFAGYLLSRQCSLPRAQVPLQTEERRRLQMTGEDSVQEVINAIRTGDFQYFLDNWPAMECNDMLHILRGGIATYAEAMTEIVENTPGNVSREALRVLFYHITGRNSASETASKFSRKLGMRELKVRSVRVNGTKTNGVSVQWSISPEQHQEYLKRVNGITDIQSRLDKKTRRKQ